MGRFSNFTAKVGSGLRSIQYREIAVNTLHRVAHPKFVPQGEITRTSQVIAAFTLPILIIVNLPIIVALSDVFTGVLQQPLGNFLTVFQFLSTLFSMGLFVFSAYLWFLYVMTGGFRLFEF